MDDSRMTDGSLMDEDVAQLAERAIAGDESAWGRLVERYAPLVWAVCLRSGVTRADAEDVVQVVWLRLLEHLPRIKVAAALPGWLVTTTRRECVHHLRSARARGRRETSAPVELVPDARSDLDEELLRAERHDALRRAFAQLDERCRRLLAALMSQPAPSYTTVSAELAMPIGSIGPTRARCLESLRRTPPVATLVTGEQQGGGTGDVHRVERRRPAGR
jgi:RNA polymerase sigma factor (sigma-70 family)